MGKSAGIKTVGVLNQSHMAVGFRGPSCTDRSTHAVMERLARPSREIDGSRRKRKFRRSMIGFDSISGSSPYSFVLTLFSYRPGLWLIRSCFGTRIQNVNIPP
jgi:hypothetical protein